MSSNKNLLQKCYIQHFWNLKLKFLCSYIVIFFFRSVSLRFPFGTSNTKSNNISAANQIFMYAASVIYKLIKNNFWHAVSKNIGAPASKKEWKVFLLIDRVVSAWRSGTRQRGLEKLQCIWPRSSLKEYGASFFFPWTQKATWFVCKFSSQGIPYQIFILILDSELYLWRGVCEWVYEHVPSWFLCICACMCVHSYPSIELLARLYFVRLKRVWCWVLSSPLSGLVSVSITIVAMGISHSALPSG